LKLYVWFRQKTVFWERVWNFSYNPSSLNSLYYNYGKPNLRYITQHTATSCAPLVLFNNAQCHIFYTIFVTEQCTLTQNLLHYFFSHNTCFHKPLYTISKKVVSTSLYIQGGAKRTHVFDICLWFLSLGLPQIKSLRSKTSYTQRSESFHLRRNCNCATRNVSKCDAELWGEAPDVCMARRTPSFQYNFP